MVSIKVEFEVSRLVEANHFGDVYMVTVDEPAPDSKLKINRFSSDSKKDLKPKVSVNTDGQRFSSNQNKKNRFSGNQQGVNLNTTNMTSSMVLHSVNKAKFNKKERTFFLKQASKMLDLKNQDSGGFTMLK